MEFAVVRSMGHLGIGGDIHRLTTQARRAIRYGLPRAGTNFIGRDIGSSSVLRGSSSTHHCFSMTSQ